MSRPTQPLVRGFKGENRLLADDLLPDNISPDAQNVDYSRGTLRKRKGYTKIHQEAIYSGGIHIDNENNNRAIVIPSSSALNLVDDFTLEFHAKFFNDRTGSSSVPAICAKYEVGPVKGWFLFYKSSVGKWRFVMVNGAGTAINIQVNANITSATIYDFGEIYHFVVTRSGTTVTFRITRLSDESSASANGTVDGETVSTSDCIIGARYGAPPANPFFEMLFD